MQLLPEDSHTGLSDLTLCVSDRDAPCLSPASQPPSPLRMLGKIKRAADGKIQSRNTNVTFLTPCSKQDEQTFPKRPVHALWQNNGVCIQAYSPI